MAELYAFPASAAFPAALAAVPAACGVPRVRAAGPAGPWREGAK